MRGDLHCCPLEFGHGSDDVNDERGLPYAAALSTHNNQPLANRRPHATGALCSHSEAFRLSSFRNRSASSGKRANQAYCSLNRSSGRAGVPHTTWPPRIVFPVGIPACAPAMAPSSSVQWSAIPTCPPTTTPLPRRELPEMPVCAAITLCSPISTLCATCTRLSIFTPVAIRVVSSDPRSIVVLQPISTSSPISTPPTWGNFHCRSSPNTYPNPSPPITVPTCTSTRWPSRAPAYSVTRGCSWHLSPITEPAPAKQNAPITEPAPISTSRSITA